MTISSASASIEKETALGQTIPLHLRVGPRQAAWVAAGLLVFIVAFLILNRMPGLRVGDGMEYYALFFAWTETLRPWMTAESFAAYQRLHELAAIHYTAPMGALQDAFNYLRLNETWDFPHFWSYSLLAALPHLAVKPLGLSLGAHQSFLVLHLTLFALALGVVTAGQGRKGAVALALIFFTSPLIWYVNKVHTEFFTFCLTVSAVSLVMRDRLIAAAVFMAAAAMQNPGFSFVAVALLAMRVFGDWAKPYSRWEVAGVVTAIGLMALHPAYYFFRHGIATPQLLGGAELGVVLPYFYIWIIDPDIGLFPNWMFGLFLLVAGLFCCRELVDPGSGDDSYITKPCHFLIFYATFLLASLYSHSSTLNLNSGATPGIARYSLWYIVLFYPLVLACVSAAWNSIRWASVLAAVTLVCTALSFVSNSPRLNESYTTPTAISYFIQRHLPKLYWPPPEIFAERYSGFGEARGKSIAVVGPDCRKTLIMPATEARTHIVVPEHCPLALEKIRGWVDRQSTAIEAPTYFTLP